MYSGPKNNPNDLICWHWNGNQLCVIDCETTGLRAGHNDMLQLCIIPLNSKYTVHPIFKPFVLDFKPRYPENADPEAMKVNKKILTDCCLHGIDYDRAIDIFDEWFSRLDLPVNKKIIPLACNWPFDRNFIEDWLGVESYNHYFDRHFRDVYPVANYINDKTNWHGEPFVFDKVKLTHLAGKLGVSTVNAHDAIADCLMTAEVYKRMMNVETNLVIRDKLARRLNEVKLENETDLEQTLERLIKKC